MTILNMMLGRKRGGAEQATADYAEALKHANIPCLTLIAPDAWLSAPLTAAGTAHQAFAHPRHWNPFSRAPHRLRAVAEQNGATAIICHGNRALRLALRSFSGRIPVIAVAHNYKTRHFGRADHCFAITEHLAQYLKTGGARSIGLMPNMVRIANAPVPRPAFRSPPVIGAMGRFVGKKGFEVYLQALTLLKARGIPFRAILGGEGEDRAKLEKLIAAYEIGDRVTLTGWVEDKRAFFHEIDIFVLPSHHEPFGIALIEAMAQALPVISTDAEGPREIVHDGIDGLITPRGNAAALADRLAELIAEPARAAALGKAAQTLVTNEYSLERMTARLQAALAPYIKAA